MDSRTTSLSLLDLVDPKRWQRLQDHFTSVVGIPLRTVSPSRELLVSPSWPVHLSAERVVSLLKVGEELERLLPPKDPPRETTTFTTSLGVTYAAVPVQATAEEPLAYFIVGPMIIGQREDEQQFRQRVSALGLDAQALWILLLFLKLYTFASIRSVLALMEEVGSSLAQFAYQAKQLDAIVPRTARVGQTVLTYDTDRVLHSLLEAARLATRADGGSVMVYDARSEALKIHVAEGLSDEVVARTTLKRGEGLAGLAMERREILLIDAQTNDPRLQSRMSRRELASSLVAPLAPDPSQDPIAILNLRTANPDRRFTQEHVELLRRLMDLAGVALKSLRLSYASPPTPISS